MQDNNFLYYQFPVELMKERSLQLSEKVLLMIIYNLDNDEGCTASNNYMAPLICMSPIRVSQLVTALEKKGFISKRYEYSNNSIERRVLNVLSRGTKYFKGGTKHIKGGVLSTFNLIENNNNKEDNKKENIKRKKQKPSIEEVKQYCCNDLQIPAEQAEAFYDHFESNGWKVGKAGATMKDWKAACRTWKRNYENWHKPQGTQKRIIV